MDNCLPHIGEAVIALLTGAPVKVVTFAPDTTRIFHVLDVVLFGALKKHATSLTMLAEEQSAAAFLIKVYHDYKQTRVEVNIWRAFAAIGLIHDITQEPDGLIFDEEKFRQGPGFLELWQGGVPFESLSS
jgi:hypothetical protein